MGESHRIDRIGLFQVQSAGFALSGAQSALLAAIEHDERILEDFDAMGTDSTVLRTTYEELPRMVEPDQSARAIDYVADCREKFRMQKDNAPPEAAHRVTMAEIRIGRLEDAVGGVLLAQEAWEASDDEGLGAFACSFPIGGCPPE